MEKNTIDTIEEIKKELQNKVDNYALDDKDEVPADLINIEEKTKDYYPERKPYRRVIGTIKV